MKLSWGMKMQVEAGECPASTSDIAANLANRQKAIDTAGYGPLNPSEPNDEFWQEKADRWKVTIEEARKQTCGSCAMWIVTPEMKACIEAGLAEGDNEQDAWAAIEAGELGYCEAFDFKCSALRTCSAWVVGGPVTELPPTTEPEAAPEAPAAEAPAEPAQAGAETVLVGLRLADDGLPMYGMDGVPFGAREKYVALLEAYGKPEDILAACRKKMEFAAQGEIVGIMTAQDPVRSAFMIDGEEITTAAIELGQLLAEASIEYADYPKVVLFGTANDMEKKEAASLKGSTVAFEGVVIVLEDGIIVGEMPIAEEAPESDEIESEEAPEVEPEAEMALGDAIASDGAVEWEGLLVIEGIMSGDSRKIELEALSWRELPLPLMIMTENPVGGGGHDGARLAGRIDVIERRENGQIYGSGVLDMNSEAGVEAKRLLSPDASGRQFLRGVSVDLDDVEMLVESDAETEPMADMFDAGVLVVTRARIMGATLTPFPAFQEAQVVLVGDTVLASLSGNDCDCAANEALVAAAGVPSAGVEARVFTPVGETALVASAAPVCPPKSWFDKPVLDGPTPLRVTPEGRVYGHVASWGSCHIGFRDRCVSVPRSMSNYRYFANKQTLTSDNVMVATGPIVIDTVHPDLRMRASDAAAFYADTGCAVADVSLYEDEYGIVAAGAVRPSTTPEQVRKLRGSDVSPDWRTINGKLECVGLLAVNTSGFVTPALVASALAAKGRPRKAGKVAASIRGGKVSALVAAGMVQHSELSSIEAELAALREMIEPIVAERNAQLASRAKAALDRIGRERSARKRERMDAALARLRSK